MQTRRAFLKATAMLMVAGPALSRQGSSGSANSTDGVDPTRILRHYQMPDVTLTDHAGKAVKLSEELRQEGPILMNFIFTSCPGICPILTATFARTAALLGEQLNSTRLWSISIDPEFDTPARLLKYRADYGAKPQWQFFTGQPGSIKSIRLAFNNDSDNKMAHQALALLRTDKNNWLRFEGALKPKALAEEISNNLVKK